MIFALLLLIALAGIGTRFLFTNAGIYLPNKFFRILIGIHLCLFLMTVSAIILSYNDIYWRGYRSTSIIIIATAVTGLLCVWLYKGKPFVLFKVFVFIQTFIAAITVLDLEDSYSKKLFYSDNKYRLENTQQFITMFESFPDLFVKNGLFERRINLNNKYDQIDLKYDLRKIKNVAISELPNQKIRIVFTYAIDTTQTKKNSVVLDVALNQ